MSKVQSNVATAYLAVQAASEYLGLSERQIRSLVYRRAIPYTKVGRLLRFRVADLEEWLEANTVRPTDAS